MSEITDEMRNAVLNARGADDGGTFMPLAEMLRHCGESKSRLVADAILSAVAPLIEAHEREAMRALLTDPAAVRVNMLRGGMAQPADLVWLHDTDGPVAAKVREAVAAEREACAQIAKRFGSYPAPASDGQTRVLQEVDGHMIAAAIRARAESKEG